MSLFFIQQYIVAKDSPVFDWNSDYSQFFPITLTLTQHLLLNSQLVTRDELTYEFTKR